MLGRLRATRGARVVDAFRTHKTAALFATLAYRVGVPQPRERLVELLWPGGDPRAGRQSLSQALSSLRRHLDRGRGASVFEATRVSITLARAGALTDVERFEAALAAAQGLAPETSNTERRARLEEAVALYPGELLPSHYHDWVLAERARLQGRFLAAAQELVALREATGDSVLAIDLARGVVACDPLGEPGVRQLMALLETSGRPREALKVFAAFERDLAIELDATPSPALQAIVHAARVREVRRRPRELPALPEPLTRFFGRSEELGRVREGLALGEQRLWTVTGAGGIGKTRFALEAARGLATDTGGVELQTVFVPIADLTEAALVPGAIRQALCVPAEAREEGDPLGPIVSTLRAGGPFVLVLDNVEQVLTGTTPIVKALLSRVPGLRCLVTSQRRLALAGEREVALGPLPVPEGDEPLAELEELPSVRLFCDRASALAPGFALTDENRTYVAGLCRRLEGIPLALHLAAGWAHVIAPRDLLARSERPLDLLIDRLREGPARHRTLRAAIAWSVEQLAEAPRRFFACVSVFRGGFSLEAAEAVTKDPLALDHLAELRESSLVEAEHTEAGVRFRLLETVRQVAAELVPEGERSGLRQAHAHQFLALAREAQAGLEGAGQVAWLDRLEGELDNLREAFAWACDPGAVTEDIVGFSEALLLLWSERGRHEEGLAWFDKALRAVPAGSPARARVLLCAAYLRQALGGLAEAHSAAEEALDLARAAEDRPIVAKALMALGAIEGKRGDLARARERLEESLALEQAGGDARRVAVALGNLWQVVWYQDDFAAARRLAGEFLTAARAVNAPDLVGAAFHYQGLVALEAGDLAEARAQLEQSVAVKRDVSVLGSLGDLSYQLEDLDAAGVHFRAAIELAEAGGLEVHAAITQAKLGRVLVVSGDVGAAEPILRSALEALDRTGVGGEHKESALVVLGDCLSAQGRRAAARVPFLEALSTACDRGSPSTIVAQALVGLAALEAHEDRFAAAARLLGAAEAVRTELSSTPRSWERSSIERVSEAARRGLGAPAHLEALAAGKKAPLADVLAGLTSA
ncbi:MAG: ATP-binding protein [Planctomycetota bacterium]|jgi:predicted ATPase/DNA-binding SARP family transcriptional activator